MPESAVQIADEVIFRGDAGSRVAASARGKIRSREAGHGTFSRHQSKTKRLRQVAFDFDGNTIMGIERNPKTKSRWADMARAGKKVMQFIQDGRYVAVAAGWKVMLYGKRTV